MAIIIGHDTNKYASLEAKKLDLDAGILGKIFGSASNAPSNIAGLTILLLLCISLYGTVYPSNTLSVADLWKITTPIITMILGYLFGRNTDK